MYEPFSRISRGGQLKIISSFGFAEGIESYCKKRSESSLLLPRPFLANINNYVNGRCCGRYANQDTAGKLLSLGKVPTLWENFACPKAALDSWYCFTIKPISITRTFDKEFYAATQLTIFVRHDQTTDKGFILCLNCPEKAQMHLQSILLNETSQDILQLVVLCLETMKELYDEAVQRLRYQVRGIELVCLLMYG